MVSGTVCIASKTMTKMSTLQAWPRSRLSWLGPCSGCGGGTTRRLLLRGQWLRLLGSVELRLLKLRKTPELKCRLLMMSIPPEVLLEWQHPGSPYGVSGQTSNDVLCHHAESMPASHTPVGEVRRRVVDATCSWQVTSHQIQLVPTRTIISRRLHD